MASRHYSTWDVIAVVYWPASQRIQLSRIEHRMRLTPSARAIQRMRERDARSSRGNVWLKTLRAAAVVAVVAAVVAFVGAQTGNRGVQVFMTLCAVVAVLIAGYTIMSQRGVNSARYLAARRLREHQLTRKSPVEFSSQLPESIRVDEIRARQDEAMDLLRTLPPMRMLAARAIDNIAVLVAFLALLPIFALTRFGGQGQLMEFAAYIFVMGVGGWALAMFGTLVVLRRQAGRALRDNACPDCGYSLAQVPPTPSQVQPELDLGPKRCPECGSPWPLIPLTLGQRLPDAIAFHPSPSTPPPPPPANPDA